MKKGIGKCAVAAIRYADASIDIITQVFAVLPKDAGLVSIRDNPAEQRFDFLIGSNDFPEAMVSKKNLDFPMIKFIIENGKFIGYEIPVGTPPKQRAKLQ